MEGYTEGVGVRHRHAVGVADIHLDEKAGGNGRTHGEASIREVSVYFFSAPRNASLEKSNTQGSGAKAGSRLGSARLYSKSFRPPQKNTTLSAPRGRFRVSAQTCHLDRHVVVVVLLLRVEQTVQGYNLMLRFAAELSTTAASIARKTCVKKIQNVFFIWPRVYLLCHRFTLTINRCVCGAVCSPCSSQ